MASTDDVYPFDNPLLNALVVALVDFKSGARDPLRLPPLRIPRRKRSRQINLQGIRDAKRQRQQQQDEEAKKGAVCCNGDGGSGVWPAQPQAKKKASKPAPKRATTKDLVPAPEFVMRETAHMKSFNRKVKDFVKENDRNHKRKVDDAGLAEQNTSNTKKLKSISESQPEHMSTTLVWYEAAETLTLAASTAQRAPFNPVPM